MRAATLMLAVLMLAGLLAAMLAEPGDMADLDDGQQDVIDHPSRYNPSWVSHVWTSASGREYYRNKAGRCEDAPCCGCCTA